MNKIIVSFLFLLFAAILVSQNSDLSINQISNLSNSNNAIFENGLCTSCSKLYKPTTNYSFNVTLDLESRQIKSNQKTIWINRTPFSTSKLFFHLYPNGYRNNKTELASGYKIEDENKSFLEIKELLVNNKRESFNYDFSRSKNTNDSTVIRIDLDYEINPNDSVIVEVKFSTKIPVSLKRFGSAKGREFYFISQWFPKLGVFEDGKWICEPYYPYTNFYSNFGNYRANITIPSKMKIGSTGVIVSNEEKDSLTSYTFAQDAIHDFAWFVTDNIDYREFYYTTQDNNRIKVELFVQPEREEYFERYKKAVLNCLEYFELNVGKYPYQKVTLVDVPRTSASGGMEYPTLFTVSADLFSPEETGYPEKLVAHEFAHQYFYGIIANNETYESWIDEGLASYFATKIIKEYYPELLINFKLASYFPVFGIQLLNYNEIPLIYSIDKYRSEPAFKQYINYYQNPYQGKISDSSFLHDSKIVYRNTNYSKPELMFTSLERILGEDKFLKVISKFYEQFKFEHPKGNELIDLFKAAADENLNWFFQNTFFSDATFDYSVNSITSEDKNHRIELIRKSEGIFYNDILVVTEKDSIWYKWNDSSRTKIISFKSEDELIGVEIDPLRKNTLDRNYANNSLKLDGNIWPALSLSIRWFFWIQNALMVLGSFG